MGYWHKFILCSFLILSVDVLWSQDLELKITVEETSSKSLSTVLSELVSNHKVPLVFSSSKLPNIMVNIPAGTYSIEEFLDYLSKKYQLKYSLSSGRIILTERESKKFTLYGRVLDAETGEYLIGANVYVNNTKTGVMTNNYGYFSLTLDAGTYELIASFIGFEPLIKDFNFSEEKRIKLWLKPKVENLDEIVVSSRNDRYNILNVTPGINTLNFDSESQLPYFLGEVDVLQGSLLLPGIRTLGEDASGLNVRGGSVDENLILLDEAVIYNPNHFFGLISVFNPEAVNQVRVMKGYIPPSYGGRSSSVIDIHQKEGNNQEFRYSGGVGLVSARFMAEGPLKKNRHSFLISARQSLLDLSVDGTNSGIIQNSRTQFQDVNAKLNFYLNGKNTIYLSGYYGNDRNRDGLDARRNWGNRTGTFRWNHSYTEKLFANYSWVVSQYKYSIAQPREAASFVGTSRIIDYSMKADHYLTINPNHELNFGFGTILHRLKPGDRLPFQEDSSSDSLFLDTEHGLEAYLFASHNWNINDKFHVEYGFRYSSLRNLGAGDVYLYDQGQTKSDVSITDTLNYKSWETIAFYDKIEPRFSLNWSLSRSSSIKFAFVRNYQYQHLISNTISPAPTDVWKLADKYIKPQKTSQYTAGFYQNFGENRWETSLEIYFKDKTNLVDYKNGADLLFNPNPETELLNGGGRAYGLEFFANYKRERFNGWLSYTLSRSERKIVGRFPDEIINKGKYFPDDHDKTHDVSLAGLYRFNERLSFSATFNFATGRPITLPLGRYTIENTIVPHFDVRNQGRISDYHRLDLSVKLDRRKVNGKGVTRKNQDFWTFNLYNVYARKNAYSYFFTESKDNPGETVVERYSIFGTIIPAITYNFRF